MIVEIVSKSGRILEVHPFTKDIITIGRAYTNDLILKDPYLDEQHLEVKFEKEAKQFLIRDCSSRNGSRIQNSNFELEAGKENAQPIGTSVHVGKSYLRFADEQQPVPAALKISKFEPTYSVLSTWWVSATLLCVLGALTLYSTYLANPFSEKIVAKITIEISHSKLKFNAGLASSNNKLQLKRSSTKLVLNRKRPSRRCIFAKSTQIPP